MAGRLFALIALWVLLPSPGAVAGTLEIEFDLSPSTRGGPVPCCTSVSGSVLLRARGVNAVGTASGEAVFATLSGLTLRLANTAPLGGLAASLTSRTTLVQRGLAIGTLGRGGLRLASGAFVADGTVDFGCIGIDCLRILIAGNRGPFTFVNDVAAFAPLPGRATPGAARFTAVLASSRGLSLQLAGAEVRRTFVPEPARVSFALVALAISIAVVSAARLLRGHPRSRLPV